MADYWKYVGTAQLPTDIPTNVKDEWEQTLKAEVTRIYTSLTNKINNESNYKARLADPSSERFASFLATVGGAWDVNEIEMKQKVKLYRQYTQWKAGIDSAFTGTSPYFPDRVTSKKGKFSLARYTLGAVGLRNEPASPYYVWGIAVKGALFIRGDTRPKLYLGANESFTGTLESVCDALRGRYITPSMIADTVKACVLAKFADEGALTTIRDNIIANANTRLDILLQAGLDTPHLTPPKDVTWVLSWDAVANHVKLTVTDIH